MRFINALLSVLILSTNSVFAYELSSGLSRTSYDLEGGTLSVIEGGPKDGEPLLFIHGIPASALLWENVLTEFINKGYRVYAPDLPGYGQTEIDIRLNNAKHLFSLEGSASLIHQWLEQQGIGPVWLVAHDIGGGVGQIFSAKYPESVNFLTLSNCIASDSWPIATISLLKTTAQLGLYDIFARIGGMEYGLSWYKLNQSVANESFMNRQVARDIFWNDKVYHEKGRAQFSEHLKALSPQQLAKYDQQLKRLQMPTLLAWAENDPNQPWEESGKQLYSLIQHAQIEFLPEAGHFFQLEKPTEYAQLLMRWRDSHNSINR
jgi:2-hydroxymuconate-semialdehyde hydrolase